MNFPSLDEVDSGVPIEFLGHAVGTYDYSASAAAFYRHLKSGELRLPHCDTCALTLHPRREFCPRCLSTDLTSLLAEGSGVLYSFSTMSTSPFEDHQGAVPYTVGIVKLTEGVAMLGRIEMPADTVAIGMSLEVDIVASIGGLRFVAGSKNSGGHR